MKVFLRIAVVCLGFLILSACASTQTAYRDAPIRNETMVTDSTYVAIVEYVAKQRGTKVLWVNAPKKRVATEVASSK